ncbi:MAG: SgcJ/EcaC family oxidoreductase [Rhizobiales bacterium]|nr:SgcJ/EcaC family oxidoreductase [Hyphomicrobiales bacterium]
MSGDARNDVRDIADLLARYETAIRARDAEACADCYAETTEYVTGGMAPVRGRAGVADLHRQIFDGGFAVEKIATHETTISGDLAYVRQTLTSNDGKSLALLVLRRQADGRWLVHAEAEVAVEA